MKKSISLPNRAEVKAADTWDLSSLFPNDAAWEKAFAEWSGAIDGYSTFKGTLGESAARLAEYLDFDVQLDRQAERVGTYSFLKCSEDMGDSKYQGMNQRFLSVASKAAELASFARPELLAIPEERMASFQRDPALERYRFTLERIIRYRPHTLSAGEERVLAMQGEMAQAAPNAFGQLNDVDLRFGSLKDEKGRALPLSHGTFSKFLQSPARAVRKKAFQQYYREYEEHAHTLSACLAGSIQKDVYYARVRGYASAREASLFDDNVPVAVYDQLIEGVRRHLPSVHRYLSLRRRALGLRELHHYDTYVPLVAGVKKTHSWKDACDVVTTAVAPLGKDYQKVLSKGLVGRWCDRYENKGKRSGAFSAGSFDGDPYILMNYEPDVLNHVFTLAHEAGHSMHSYYSAKHQPFHLYNYTIFVAEVASTFNEQLLLDHFLTSAKSKKERAYLLNKAIDDIRATIVRQTMFAEFEKAVHASAEKGEPLTLEGFQQEYRRLLEAYFGAEFVIDDALTLECLRIPHFYRAFYVYKYATGLSAAIALSRKVLKGGRADRDAYLHFLQGGGSKYPLELLKDAGVDMTTSEPLDAALDHFAQLVEELESLL